MVAKIEINVKKDRKEIANIIEINVPLLIKNPKLISQELADCIIGYLVGAFDEKD